MITHLLRVIFTLFLLSVSAGAAPQVTGVSVHPVVSGGEELRFATSAQLTPTKIFALSNPDRAVIALPLVAIEALQLPADYRGTLARGVRFGRFDEQTSRLVIDLAGPAAISASSDASGIQVNLVPVGGATSSVSPFKALEGATSAAVIPEKKKPLIVIDAGHGGQDPGAIGIGHSREKDVTLLYAKALKKALLRTGRYRVALTREDDRFIMLADRVAIARQAKGDVFISLHADSNPNKDAKGLSLYSLSENASDTEAAALAEQENKVDLLSGVSAAADEDIANILIDLTQRETMAKSSVLADTIVQQLHPKITQLPNTHRYAGFRVLKAPDIPSVLVELGFLSAAADEKRLNSTEYRGLVVESLVKGIDRFMANEKL